MTSELRFAPMGSTNLVDCADWYQRFITHIETNVDTGNTARSRRKAINSEIAKYGGKRYLSTNCIVFESQEHLNWFVLHHG